MCDAIILIERILRQFPMDNRQVRLLAMAKGCCALRILICLAYRDDAGEILHEIRKVLDRWVE